jgi:hypothetical protein
MSTPEDTQDEGMTGREVEAGRVAGVSSSGQWQVRGGQLMTPDGVTTVTVIGDDDGNHFITAKDPEHLIIALMLHLDLDHIRLAIETMHEPGCDCEDRDDPTDD